MKGPGIDLLFLDLPKGTNCNPFLSVPLIPVSHYSIHMEMIQNSIWVVHVQ